MARLPEGGVGGEGRGGRAVVPHLPSSGGQPVPPAQPPPFAGAFPLGILGRPGPLRSPRPRARPGRPSVGQPGGGGGAAGAPPPPLGLGRGLFPRRPRAGTKAGPSVPRPPYCIPGCRRPGPVYGAPLSASAGLPAWCGHCGSEPAAEWRHSACSRACSGRGFPPWVPRPSLGGMRGRCPPGWPPAVRGPGGERGWRGGGVPVTPLRSPGAALRRPRKGGLVVSVPGGQPSTVGCILLLPPPILRAPGRRAAASPRGAGWPGGGGGRRVLGVAAWVSG